MSLCPHPGTGTRALKHPTLSVRAPNVPINFMSVCFDSEHHRHSHFRLSPTQKRKVVFFFVNFWDAFFFCCFCVVRKSPTALFVAPAFRKLLGCYNSHFGVCHWTTLYLAAHSFLAKWNAYCCRRNMSPTLCKTDSCIFPQGFQTFHSYYRAPLWWEVSICARDLWVNGTDVIPLL